MHAEMAVHNMPEGGSRVCTGVCVGTCIGKICTSRAGLEPLTPFVEVLPTLLTGPRRAYGRAYGRACQCLYDCQERTESLGETVLDKQFVGKVLNVAGSYATRDQCWSATPIDEIVAGLDDGYG